MLFYMSFTTVSSSSFKSCLQGTTNLGVYGVYLYRIELESSITNLYIYIKVYISTIWKNSTS